MATGKFYGAAADYNKPPGLAGINRGNIFKILGLSAGALILIIVGYVAFTALTSAGRNDAARLVARERVVLNFMTSNQAALSSDDLKTITSNAISLQLSDIYSLQQGLKTSFSLTTIPDDITKSEADTTSAKALVTAKTQGQFDQKYIQLLRDKIAAAQNLTTSVQNGSSGAMKTATQTNLNHLKIIDEQLTKLNL